MTSHAKRDPFAVLGLDDSASQKEVESAYRRRALHCHPDRRPWDPSAKVRFERLSEAKEELLDHARREAAVLRRRAARTSPAETAGRTRGSSAASKAARVRMVAAEKRRQEAAEALHRREAVAARERRQRQSAEAAAEAKQRQDILFAEEDARERTAKREREKAAVFEAWRQRRLSKAEAAGRATTGAPGSAVQPSTAVSPLRALLKSFAASGRQTLVVAGPLSSAELVEVATAASQLELIVVAADRDEGGGKRCGLLISRRAQGQGGGEGSGATVESDDSPWEPPEGTQAEQKRRASAGQRMPRGQPSGQRSGCTDWDAAGPPGAAVREERHRRAVERLRVRRLAGEGLCSTLLGSWWVHDEEADRYSQYVDQCGF